MVPEPVRRDRALDVAGPPTRSERWSRTAMLLEWAARLVGAALLAAMAGIHMHLWNTGYRTIAVIGPLFLVNAIAGALLCVAVVAAPRKLLVWVSAAGAGLLAGTLLGLLLSATTGLFGFTESLHAPLVAATIATELAGTVVLGGLAVYLAAQHPLFIRLRNRGETHPT